MMKKRSGIKYAMGMVMLMIVLLAESLWLHLKEKMKGR